MSADETTYYIYILIDPRTNDVRYVGSTRHPERRLRQHLSADRNTRRDGWIQALKDVGLNPFMEIVHTCNESDWMEQERFFIQLYRERGFSLTNLTDGGEGKKGYQAPTETLDRMSESHKGQVPHNKRAVVQYSLDGKQLIRLWDSATDVQRAGITSRRKVSACCRREVESAGDHVWRYADEV